MNELEILVIICFSAWFFGGIVIAYLTKRSIKKDRGY